MGCVSIYYPILTSYSTDTETDFLSIKYQIMERPRTKLAAGLLATVLVGCSQAEPVAETDTGNPVSDYSLLIDRNKTDISASDASKVATMFSDRSKPLSRSIGVGSIETIADETDGTPLLYVVNDADGSGFTLVSATKKCAPVLAYSDEGSFNVTPDGPTEFYLNLYKEAIRAANADQSDSLRKEYALEWAMFETPQSVEMSRAAVTNLSVDKQNHIAEMEAKGYRYVGNLTGAKEFLPPSEYQALYNDVTSHANPQYGIEESTMFFLKENNQVTGPLLATRWNQWQPFSIGAPNDMAGCLPVAVAQIMYYHKQPTSINWSAIPVNPQFDNQVVGQLLTDIRSKGNASYVFGDGNTYGATRMSMPAAASVLNGYGYSAVYYSTININSAYSQLFTYKNPLIISGKDKNGNESHAWVNDGFKRNGYLGIISFVPQNDVMLKDPSSVFYDYGFTPYPPSELPTMNPRKTIDYFHVNSATSKLINEALWLSQIYIDPYSDNNSMIIVSHK